MSTAAPPRQAVSSAASGDPDEGSRMSFGDHLDQLRASIIRALIGVALATIVCLGFGKEILELICRPLYAALHDNGLPMQLQALAPPSAFAAYLKIALLSGLIVSMPWTLYQLWLFVASGLYRHERRFARTLVPASLGLFVLGVLFLYSVVLPIALNFFIRFNGSFELPAFAPAASSVEVVPDATDVFGKAPLLATDPPDPKPGEWWVNTSERRLKVRTADETLSLALYRGATPPAMLGQFAIDYYISFVLWLALAFGIAFETPIVVFFLAWSGIASRSTMAKGRRYVILVIVIAAAVLTPPDVVSQILLAIPMALLFELGIWSARFAERKSTAEP